MYRPDERPATGPARPRAQEGTPCRSAPRTATATRPTGPAISQHIRFVRAAGRCECAGECGRGTHIGRCPNLHGAPAYGTGSKVVLTTAHLDHTPEHCAPANLVAMCQGCHLHYDREHHALTAAATRRAAVEAAGQLAILPIPATIPGEPAMNPPHHIADRLTATAAGTWGEEAAIWLLDTHGHWLPELDRCGYIAKVRAGTATIVRFREIYAEHTRLIGTRSEWQVLRTAADLAGQPFDDWAARDLNSLDEQNRRLVLHAVAWAAGGRHWADQLGLLTPAAPTV